MIQNAYRYNVNHGAKCTSGGCFFVYCVSSLDIWESRNHLTFASVYSICFCVLLHFLCSCDLWPFAFLLTGTKSRPIFIKYFFYAFLLLETSLIIMSCFFRK